MPSLYEMTHNHEVASTLEEMRIKLSKEFGVTVVGNRCTLRWYEGKELVQVHMIVENVTTADESRESTKQRQRFEAFIQQHKKDFPNLREELHYAEHGEHSQ